MLKMMKTLPEDCVVSEMKSPVGTLTLLVSDKGLHAVLWEKDVKEKECRKIMSAFKNSTSHPVLKESKKQLKEYFAGKRKEFSVPYVLDGTVFQKKVWKQLTKIPYAETISYGTQAKRIGDAKKARAVGAANGRNPISIIVPCHRVIGASGKLIGFGGGLKNKQYLLDLERNG